MYRTNQGYIQDTFVQDTFLTWTGLSTGQNTGHHILDRHILNKDKNRTYNGLELTGDKGNGQNWGYRN